MADDNEAASEEEKPAGGKKKIILLVIGAIALLGLGGGGAVLFMGGGEAANETAEEVIEEPERDPIYIPLDPTFVVNFQDEQERNHFLKAEVNVLTFDKEVEEAIAKHMPLIRNNLVLLFNRQVFEDLLGQQGKDVLRAEALAQVQSVIEKYLGKPGVEELFFTTLVTQ
mgnify:CR=1 FL=1